MCLFGYLGLANYIDLDVVVRLLRCLFGVVVCGFYCGSVVIVWRGLFTSWFSVCWLSRCFVFVGCDCWLLVVLRHFYSFCCF